MPFDLTATRNITNIRFRAKKTVPITISGDRGKASRCQRSSLSANIRCFVVFLLATTFGVEWLGWRSLPVKVVRDYYCVLLCTFLSMCAKFFFFFDYYFRKKCMKYSWGIGGFFCCRFLEIHFCSSTCLFRMMSLLLPSPRISKDTNFERRFHNRYGNLIFF